LVASSSNSVLETVIIISAREQCLLVNFPGPAISLVASISNSVLETVIIISAREQCLLVIFPGPAISLVASSSNSVLETVIIISARQSITSVEHRRSWLMAPIRSPGRRFGHKRIDRHRTKK
jgi:hypothetical protein